MCSSLLELSVLNILYIFFEGPRAPIPGRSRAFDILKRKGLDLLKQKAEGRQANRERRIANLQSARRGRKGQMAVDLGGGETMGTSPGLGQRERRETEERSEIVPALWA